VLKVSATAPVPMSFCSEREAFSGMARPSTPREKAPAAGGGVGAPTDTGPHRPNIQRRFPVTCASVPGLDLADPRRLFRVPELVSPSPRRHVGVAVLVNADIPGDTNSTRECLCTRPVTFVLGQRAGSGRSPNSIKSP